VISILLLFRCSCLSLNSNFRVNCLFVVLSCICPAFSCPAFFWLATWSFIFMSCIFTEPGSDATTVRLMQTVTEITSTEKSIVDLKKAIKSKENEVKVCQTRLFLREKRPNVEQCRDPVHYQLVLLYVLDSTTTSRPIGYYICCCYTAANATNTGGLNVRQ